MRPSRNTSALQTVAAALGPLLAEIVFVGGATIGLYAAALVAPESRYTEDGDCIIDLASYAHFVELEEKLRQRGFRHDQTRGIQIRWRWQDRMLQRPKRTPWTLCPPMAAPCWAVA